MLLLEIAMGVCLIILLMNLAQENSCESELNLQKHIGMRITACIFAALGILYLVAYLYNVINAHSMAEIEPLNPFVFVYFALSAYFFNFKKSNTSIGKKLLKIAYILVLIICYDRAIMSDTPMFFIVVCFGLFMWKSGRQKTNQMFQSKNQIERDILKK